MAKKRITLRDLVPRLGRINQIVIMRHNTQYKAKVNGVTIDDDGCLRVMGVNQGQSRMVGMATHPCYHDFPAELTFSVTDLTWVNPPTPARPQFNGLHFKNRYDHGVQIADITDVRSIKLIP